MENLNNTIQLFLVRTSSAPLADECGTGWRVAPPSYVSFGYDEELLRVGDFFLPPGYRLIPEGPIWASWVCGGNGDTPIVCSPDGEPALSTEYGGEIVLEEVLS